MKKTDEKSRRRLRAADRISSLPDDVLCRILSLVSTQEAVATSVLSKRWTHLWRYIDNIEFKYIEVDSIESYSKFNNSVNSVLISRDVTGGGSHSINRFSLNIEYSNPRLDYHLSIPNVVEWINIVVQRRLKHLCLRLHVEFVDPVYPGNEDEDEDEDEDDDVDDENDDYNANDDVDNNVVVDVNVDNNVAVDVDHRLPKLPISIFTCKTLVSLDLNWFSVKGFSFSSIGFGFPSLKTLWLSDIHFTQDRDFILLLHGCPVLEDLELFRIKLHYDEEDSFAIQQFKSLSLPKLIRADITHFVCYYFPLKVLSTSESLCLDIFKLYRKGKVYQKVYQVPPPLPLFVDIPDFHNLTYLELHNSWPLVVQVLPHCPKLQNLKLNEDSYTISYAAMGTEEDWVDPVSVPQCLLSHLRTCTFQYHVCLIGQLMLAKYILKNANFLQSMTMSSERDKRKLAPCPKASSTCQLLVDSIKLSTLICGR